MFKALANEDRKRIIKALETKSTYTLDELVAECSGHKRTHRAVKSQFHHKHLPKLADFGVIIRDDNSDLIKRGPQFQKCLDVLHSSESGDPSGDGDAVI